MDTQNVLENQEFAASNKHKDLSCKGRNCAKCGKCRDWYYTGDSTTWHWIQNVQNWTASDWQRYDNDRVDKSFRRRDGYTCCCLNYPVLMGIIFLIIGGGILSLGIYLLGIIDDDDPSLKSLMYLLITYGCLGLLAGLLNLHGAFGFGFGAVRRFLIVCYGDALFFFLGGIIALVVSIIALSFNTPSGASGIVYSIGSIIRGIGGFIILGFSIFGGGLHHGNFCLCGDNLRNSF